MIRISVGNSALIWWSFIRVSVWRLQNRCVFETLAKFSLFTD